MGSERSEVAANGILTTESEDFNEKMEQYRSILKKEKAIVSAVSYAEKQFAPYAEYLD